MKYMSASKLQFPVYREAAYVFFFIKRDFRKVYEMWPFS